MKPKRTLSEQIQPMADARREAEWERQEKAKDVLRYAVRGDQIVEDIATLEEARRVAEGINGKIWATLTEDGTTYYAYPIDNEE